MTNNGRKTTYSLGKKHTKQESPLALRRY